MPEGPGKYDDLATYVREQSNAETVLVVIIGGVYGQGFSVQSENPEVLVELPQMLRYIASQIEAN